MTTFSIESFAVGDRVEFERRFTEADFTAFSKLSGDANPLHHDAVYAKATSLGRTIVPLHMTLSPLSMIAGMIFPGEPSLYLGHDVRASKPVFYNDVVHYSARIMSINAPHRVLEISVLALRGADIMLHATLKVQAQAERWSTPSSLHVIAAATPPWAVITGASGEIGSAVARTFARKRYRLALIDRGNTAKRQALEARLAETGAEVRFLTADLANPDHQDRVAAELSKLDDVGLVVHAASPGVDAPIENLVAVNFTAFKKITQAALPSMLARQKATVMLIGSIATEKSIPGWENYSGAKSMAANLASNIERSYSSYGVRGLVLMPGRVETPFSRDIAGADTALLPAEVAEAVSQALDGGDGNTIWLEPHIHERGRLGFHRSAVTASPVHMSTAAAGAGIATVTRDASALEAIARRVLRLSPDVRLTDGGLGITPGWDSLKQIELVLAIESGLGIRFSSSEMEAVQLFAKMETIVHQKLNEETSQ